MCVCTAPLYLGVQWDQVERLVDFIQMCRLTQEKHLIRVEGQNVSEAELWRARTFVLYWRRQDTSLIWAGRRPILEEEKKKLLFYILNISLSLTESRCFDQIKLWTNDADESSSSSRLLNPFRTPVWDFKTHGAEFNPFSWSFAFFSPRLKVSFLFYVHFRVNVCSTAGNNYYNY